MSIKCTVLLCCSSPIAKISTLFVQNLNLSLSSDQPRGFFAGRYCLCRKGTDTVFTLSSHVFNLARSAGGKGSTQSYQRSVEAPTDVLVSLGISFRISLVVMKFDLNAEYLSSRLILKSFCRVRKGFTIVRSSGGDDGNSQF